MPDDALNPVLSGPGTASTIPAAARFVAYLRVSTEGQGRSGLGLEAQGEAVAVLNDCAAANAQVLGAAAADLAGMQRAATEAMQAATRQVVAAIDEMRRRMTDLQEETGRATGTAGEGGA